MNTELMELLRTRRTYRRFDQTQAVPEDAIRRMKEALRLASSAGNAQTLQYVFVSDPELAEAVFPHTHWAAMLPKELGTPGPGEHPVLYVAVLANEEKKGRWTDFDAGLAVSNLTLAAWKDGFGSCIMGNIDRKELAELLRIRPPMALQCIVAFGRPTHASTVVEPGKDGSLKYYLDERKDYFVPKRPVEDFIFDNAYERKGD